MWLDSLSKLGRNRCSARVRENKKEIDAFFSFAWICCCSTKQQLALHTWTGGDWVTISYKSGEPSVISQALPSSWRRGLCKRRLGRILLWKNSDSTATRLERFISERDSASVLKFQWTNVRPRSRWLDERLLERHQCWWKRKRESKSDCSCNHFTATISTRSLGTLEYQTRKRTKQKILFVSHATWIFRSTSYLHQVAISPKPSYFRVPSSWRYLLPHWSFWQVLAPPVHSALSRLLLLMKRRPRLWLHPLLSKSLQLFRLLL